MGVSRSLLELVGEAALLIQNEQFPHEVMRIFPFLVNLWFCPAPNWRPWLCGYGAVVTVFARASHWKKTGGELLAGGDPAPGLVPFRHTLTSLFPISTMKEYPARLYMGGFPPYEVMHQFSYSRVAAALRVPGWPMLYIRRF